MDDLAKREKLKSLYPDSKTWAEEVDKMTDSKVTVVLMRLKLQGKLK